MKKLMLSPLLTIALLILSLASYAHDTPLRRIISTNGYGEVKVKPDMAVLDLSVRATHKSGKAAKQDVDDRINNFLDVLKTLGIKQEDIVASNLQVHARYEHSTGQRLFQGYQASRNLSVKIHRLEMLTDLMDKALEQKLEGIDRIQYDSSDADKHRDEAHRLAIENSKKKASALAAAYGAELGPVLTINYHNRTPIYGGIKAEAADAMPASLRASSPGTYITDELVFSDNIQVTFDLIISE